MKYPEWYIQNIEEPIREVVYKLRNSGVNTICSCGHKMWVQFEASDPTTIFWNIFNVMNEMKIKDWRIEVSQESMGGNMFPQFGQLYVGRKSCDNHANNSDAATLIRIRESFNKKS